MNQHTGNRRHKSTNPVKNVAEPSVRHWNHTITSPGSNREPDPDTHYLYCTLSYQNQLLSEIKSLLEQLTLNQSDSQHRP